MGGLTSFLKVLLYVLIIVNLIIIIINLVQTLNEIKETKVVLRTKVGEKSDQLPDNYKPIRFWGPIDGKSKDEETDYDSYPYAYEPTNKGESPTISDDKVMAKYLIKVHKMGHEEKFIRIKTYHSVFLAFYVVIAVLGIYGLFKESVSITYAFGIITLLSWVTRLLLYVLSNGIQYGPFDVKDRWLSSKPLFEVWSLTLYFITGVIGISVAICMRRDFRMKQ